VSQPWRAVLEERAAALFFPFAPADFKAEIAVLGN
jgi:hypothetical protein